MLSAARKAGVPIPVGEVVGEKPDFWFTTDFGPLGIELSEVLRPAAATTVLCRFIRRLFMRKSWRRRNWPIIGMPKPGQ